MHDEGNRCMMMHDVPLTQKHKPLFSHSTKNHAENIIGVINKIFSKKEMGEEEEKGSVITKR